MIYNKDIINIVNTSIEENVNNSLLFKLIRVLFSKTFKNFQQAFGLNVINKFKDQLDEEKEEYRNMERELLIGKPIICIGNSNNFPIIGFLEKYDINKNGSIPLPIVKSYSGKEVKEFLTFSTVVPFTDQKLKCLISMTGEEIYSLIGFRGQIDYDCDFEPCEETNTKYHQYHPLNVINGHELIVERLKENGFYDRISKMKKEE